MRAGSNCRRNGCAGLVRGGVCSVCGDLRRREDRLLDARRGSAASRGYGSRWRKVRGMVLAAQPLCVDCQAESRVTAASEVHHVVARRDGGTDALSNLMALCKSCHSRRTAQG